MSDSIWDWVYTFIWDLYDDDQEELSDKIENFSSLAYDKNQEEVEAVYPELLVYARQSDNVWLEVFLRHWRLQAYVNTNLDPRPLVQEVLDLLALTQTNAKAGECPQATCVIDDLNDIYRGIDAEGFAEERNTILKEQLETLSPHRECYMCMSVGRLEALLDLGQPSEALASWQDACRVSTAVTDVMQAGEHFNSYVSESLMRAHVMMGDWAATQELIDAATPKSDEHANRVDLLQASVWNGQGRTPDAEVRILSVLNRKPEDIPVDQACRTINEVFDGLSKAGKESLLPILNDLAKLSLERGRAREGFDAAALAAKMGLCLDESDTAGTALQHMKNAIPALNRPEGAQNRILAISEQIEAL